MGRRREGGGVPSVRVPDSIIGPAHSAFEPERLDDSIRESLVAMERMLHIWRELEPLVEGFLKFTGVAIREVVETENPDHFLYLTKDGKPATKEGWARETMGNLTTYVERLSRGMTNILKVVNDASRLRIFLAGGQTEDQELDNMSDADLAKRVYDVAKGRLGMEKRAES